MKIIEKIDELHRFIGTPAGAAKGEAMRVQACNAIRDGMKSRKWAEYMSNFASNPDQLQRLLGEDEEFNDTAWGRDCLAYVAANAVCGVGTTTGTLTNMPQQMIDALDFDLNHVTKNDDDGNA